MTKLAKVLVVVAIGCAGTHHGSDDPLPAPPPPSAGWVVHQAQPAGRPNAAYRWMHVMQEAAGRGVDRVGARPTIISRDMHMGVTAMYDAWAAYDAKAVGTRFGGKLRRPPAERTLANKETAVAYAMYRILLNVYPEDAAWIEAQMRADGHDPADVRTDPTLPQGIGNAVAAAIIEYRRNDGANQYGTEVGGSGQPYSDYTFYEPRNPPDKIIDPDRWQPLPFLVDGQTIYPGFLTPHWYRVKPFALERADQFRPPPPPKVGSAKLKAEVDENIEANATLTLQHKTIVELMRDGPRSTGQSGHWLRFAADISRRDKYTLDQDVKLFFAVGNIVFDAFISCWETKRFYDSSRPWTLVRHYYAGKQIQGYLGACKGVGAVAAEQWHPYSPRSFVTPPFPGYTSGHATASGAAARILELFTGSDRLEVVVLRKAGDLTETQCSAGEMQAKDGVPARIPDKKEVKLELPTLSSTAAMAADSRMLGGYHIATDNSVGLDVGKKIADYSWPRYQAYFEGTASVRE